VTSHRQARTVAKAVVEAAISGNPSPDAAGFPARLPRFQIAAPPGFAKQGRLRSGNLKQVALQPIALKQIALRQIGLKKLALKKLALKKIVPKGWSLSCLALGAGLRRPGHLQAGPVVLHQFSRQRLAQRPLAPEPRDPAPVAEAWPAAWMLSPGRAAAARSGRSGPADRFAPRSWLAPSSA
jgi:hypothetical protein